MDSAKESAAWWHGLSSPEQMEIVTHDPARIHDRDGVSAWARDIANRKLLERDLTEATLARSELALLSPTPKLKLLGRGTEESDPARFYTERARPYYELEALRRALWAADPIADQVQAKLDEITSLPERLERLRHLAPDNLASTFESFSDRISKRLRFEYSNLRRLDAMADTTRRQLLVYSPATGEPGHEALHAVVAVGNVDTAQNIAVLVPGMGTSVRASMEYYTSDVITFYQRASVRTKDSLAVVTFLGYDAPPRPFPMSRSFDYSVLFPERAERGAAYLRRFLEGIHASHAADPKHEGTAPITLLMHSYGSVVGVKALEGMAEGIVSDAILFGSPGLVADVDSLPVPAGHVYSMLYESDAVGILAEKLRPYGIGHGTSVNTTKGIVGVDPGSPYHVPGFSTWAHNDYSNDGSPAQEKMVDIFLHRPLDQD